MSLARIRLTAAGVLASVLVVGGLVATAAKTFLNTISVSKSGKGKGKVTSSPEGIGCGKTCRYGYADGTSVTLKTEDARGSKFSGWSGACKGAHGCEITANGNVTVNAGSSSSRASSPTSGARL